MPSIKEQLGCWLHERWRTELVLRAPAVARNLGLRWVELKNRHESLKADPLSQGPICEWSDSSVLTVGRLFPSVATRLLTHCQREWPMTLCAPDATSVASGPVDATVIVPVRGLGRLPLFRASLASLLAQQNAGIEIIVVEQDFENLYEAQLPQGITYLHARSTCPEMPFNKSWAINVAARHASGEILVLHDADHVVPTNYVASICSLLSKDVDATLPARFIFHMTEESTQEAVTTGALPQSPGIEKIVQNNPTPLAVRRDAYWKIGGHDEAFFGWGGEDNEFLSRLATLRLSRGGFLPLIHLWHPPAPNKVAEGNQHQRRSIEAVSAEQRIARLLDQDLGRSQPAVSWEALSAQACTA